MSIAYLDPGNIESDLQAGAVAEYKVSRAMHDCTRVHELVYSTCACTYTHCSSIILYMLHVHVYMCICPYMYMYM